MSKIIMPTIAATAVALYFFSRRRKVEIEVEIEPFGGESKAEGTVDPALAAE